MNKTLGLQLVVYSLLLAGLSYLAYHLVPAAGRTALITGLVGGALSLIWGLRGLMGRGGKALPILTLLPVSYVMLTQTVLTWSGGGQAAPGRRTAAMILAVLLVLSIAMLMRIAYAGAAFEEPAAKPMKAG